jgi:hypothetical protein
LDVRGATAAGPGVLKLTTGELTNVDGGILGRLEFQAPLDSAGTDATLVAASIWAEADATFSSSVNTTDLVFATATSATATEKLRITSTGVLKINNAYCLPTADGSASQFLCTNGSGALGFATLVSSPWSTSGCFITTPAACFVGVGTATPASLLDVRGTVQVGVNDTGHDVTFFGAASGCKFLWDEDVNELQIVGSLSMKGYIAGGSWKTEVASGTTWSFGWWQSSNGQWWLLGNTADADTFTRAEAEFYIPTGDISDVPSS